MHINMMVSLNRNRIILIAIAVIILYLFLNRFQYIRKSNFATGEVVALEIKKDVMSSEKRFSCATIEFEAGDEIVCFSSERDVKYEIGETVKVIYKKDNPLDAKVYSFAGFWLAPTLYCIIPLWLIIAIILSFMNKNALIMFNFKRGFSYVKEIKQISNIENQLNQ